MLQKTFKSTPFAYSTWTATVSMIPSKQSSRNMEMRMKPEDMSFTPSSV